MVTTAPIALSCEPARRTSLAIILGFASEPQSAPVLTTSRSEPTDFTSRNCSLSVTATLESRLNFAFSSRLAAKARGYGLRCKRIQRYIFIQYIRNHPDFV